MKAGEIAVAIEPPDFCRMLLRDEQPEVRVAIDAAVPLRAETARGYLQGFALSYIADQTERAYGEVVATSGATVETRFRYNQAFKSVFAIVPSVIVLMLVLIERRPEPQPFSVANGGMNAGPGNPMGARALYLFQNGVDTLYRIYGDALPRQLGKAVSSGCIWMLNQNVIHLHEHAVHGASMIVLPSLKPEGLGQLCQGYKKACSACLLPPVCASRTGRVTLSGMTCIQVGLWPARLA